MAPANREPIVDRKYLVRWAASAFVLGGTIALAGWLRSNSRELLKIGVAIGLLPFLLGPLHLYNTRGLIVRKPVDNLFSSLFETIVLTALALVTGPG